MKAPQLTAEEERRRRKRLDEEEGWIDEYNGSCHGAPNVRSDANEADRGNKAGASKNAAVDALGGAGVYMPPAKRRQLLESQLAAIQEDTTLLQRQTWQDQKRAVHGTVNRLNESTIKPLIHELFLKVNLLRLRGVLARSLLQAAVSSPRYSNVYAALVAVLNTKLPEVGELVVKRAILAFRRHYRRKEKAHCLAMAIFIGHLFHQAVVHELLVLQILTLLLDGDPTDDSVEVAVQFLTVTGHALIEVSPAGVRAVLERLRALLHEGNLNKRVEYKMEQLLKMRKNGFRDNPPIPEELDLVERDDQITFELSLDDEDITKDDQLDIFRLDEEYDENEKIWAKIQREILGGDGDSEGDDETDEGGGDDESEEEEEVPDQELAILPAKAQNVVIQDLSEADLIHLRRQIYLTIMSSASFEECAHKLTKITIPPGRESELINMIIECTSQERTFLRYYGLIGARFCLLEDRWRDAFMEAFVGQYTTIHRLETNKLRNVAKLFAHLLHTDSMPWSCLGVIHLNEDETTSSSRIFVKILIQEIAEAMGIAALKKRFDTDDPELMEWYKGMFPRDNVRNTRYAINFFTSIGLGPLTDGLREFLKNAPKMILAQAQLAAAAQKKDDDSSSVSSSSSSSSSSISSSSSDSDSSSSSSSSYPRRRRKRRSPSYSSSSDSDSSEIRRGGEKERRGRKNSYTDSSQSGDTQLEPSKGGKVAHEKKKTSRSPHPGKKEKSAREEKTRGGRQSRYSTDSSDEGRPRKKKGGKLSDNQDISRSPTPDKKARGSTKDKVEEGNRKRGQSGSYSSDDSRDGDRHVDKRRRD
jgi:pre-mRNA-splicing factor CWC22